MICLNLAVARSPRGWVETDADVLRSRQSDTAISGPEFRDIGLCLSGHRRDLTGEPCVR